MYGLTGKRKTLNVYNHSLGLNFLMGFSAIYFSHKYLLTRSIFGKSEEKKAVQKPFKSL